MKFDVNKIIMESIQEVIEKANIEDNPELAAEKKVVAETMDNPELAAAARNIRKGDNELLIAKLGKKAVKKIKDAGEDVADVVKGHPYVAGGTAAALAAGLGALALRKKLAATSKTTKKSKK